MTTLGVRRALARPRRRDDAGAIPGTRSGSGSGSGPGREGEATERILRVLYLAVGIGGVVYAAVGFTKTMSQVPYLTGWFGWGGWIFSTGCPVILAALALRAPLPLLRRIATAYGVVSLALLALWPTQQLSFELPGESSPWTNDVLTVSVIAIAITWRARPLWVFAVLSAALSGYARFTSDPDIGITLAALDAAYNLLMNCTFAALVVVTKQGAARQDAAAEAARLETSREAEASARVQQRVRIDALVHDHVLSALLIASRPSSAPRDALQSLAASTLDTLRGGSPLGAEPLTEEDFVSRLRSSVTSQGDGIGFVTELDGTVAVPADIAQALLEAAAEAVRNSLRHARPTGGGAVTGSGSGFGHGSGSGHGSGADGEPTRTVRVRADLRGVEIVVNDDGQGFNSRRIPAERLGVRVSILTRMETVDGGYASVDSTRGVGTTVTIGWRPTGSAAFDEGAR